MTWAYSPSYGKPLSVPQGIIGLMTGYGMKVELAYPEGYDLIPEVIDIAKKQCNRKWRWIYSKSTPWKKPLQMLILFILKAGLPFSDAETNRMLLKNKHEGLKILGKRMP